MTDKDLHNLQAWTHQLKDDLIVLNDNLNDMLDEWSNLSKQAKHALLSVNRVISIAGEHHKKEEEWIDDD
jgi:ElaB/YqjD/DUF883 family membrane-anchored ribosome-binding protein